MLKGRESLIRLVGKRRRFLPNRQSLLSTSVQSSLHIERDRNGPTEAQGSSQKRSENVAESSSASEWVTCPVCGISVSGLNDTINSHLDACLAKGTKRKLSQRTLLQLNFCSKSKGNTLSSESGEIGVGVVQRGHHGDIVCGSIDKLVNNCGVEENASYPCQPSLRPEFVRQSLNDGQNKNQISNVRIKNVEDSSTLSTDEVLKYDMPKSVNEISGVALETFIVGRRYSDEVELNPGARISLLREPDNAKDPNAMKVISGESECCKVLGYLPRELAQYLSPLMEKYGLSFEGHGFECIVFHILKFSIAKKQQRDYQLQDTYVTTIP